MNIQIQQLEVVDKQVKSHIKKNPNASLATLFKKFRKSPHIWSYGDYPLLIHLAQLKTKLTGKSYTDRQITNAIQLIEDYPTATKKLLSEIKQHIKEIQKSVRMLPKKH